MKKEIRGWTLLIVLSIINGSVFTLDDWQFWSMCIGSALIKGLDD
jgi:hypothetical protein